MREKLFSITKKDFEFDTFRSGGKGGQHQNKTESGVRIRHKESGAIGEARDSKHQVINKRRAFERLIENPKFKLWLQKKIYQIQGLALTEEELQKVVDDMMQPKNLKIEYGVSE